MGTRIELKVGLSKREDVQPIWDVFTRQIWPIFAPNIRHFVVSDGHHLDNLHHLISPTVFTDLHQLNSIFSDWLFPDSICDDGPNAIPTAGQALSKWLHTPGKDGQPKRLFRNNYFGPLNLEWVNDFKETFLRSITSVSYTIRFHLFSNPMPIEPFELVNERTNEKLTLMKDENDDGKSGAQLLGRRWRFSMTKIWTIQTDSSVFVVPLGRCLYHQQIKAMKKCSRLPGQVISRRRKSDHF